MSVILRNRERKINPDGLKPDYLKETLTGLEVFFSLLRKRSERQEILMGIVSTAKTFVWRLSPRQTKEHESLYEATPPVPPLAKELPIVENS